ncbi:MAG: hypothetical protein JO108_01275 [Acidobacteriaceae bacterium]|nr:hypothetical protein [Acidobacteriaceae bacterium]
MFPVKRRIDLYHVFDLLSIVAVPLGLGLQNPSWIYPRWYDIDEWVYVGYGYRYLNPTFYSENYKISRLPWVLTEALIRGTFPPPTASWILSFGVLALGNVALYFALRLTFGRASALITSIFIAGFTFMYANGGADYHNTLAGAFYCFSTFLCALYARRQFDLRHPTLLGAVVALTIHTNIVFINLVPLLLAQYWLCYRIYHGKHPPLLTFVLAALVGALGITIFLGLINLSVGRQFFFFLQQFKIVRYFLADSARQQIWWYSWSSHWYLDHAYMGVFLAGVLLSCATLALTPSRRSLPSQYTCARLFSVAYLCAVLIWIFWQSIGQTAFEPLYFAFPLGFPLAGTLAATLAIVVVEEVRPIVLTVFGACFAALTIVALREAVLIDQFVGGVSWPFAVRVAIAFSLAFALLLLLRSSLAIAPVAVFALCIANAIAVADKASYAATSCSLNRDAYELILKAGNLLRKINVPRPSIYLFADYGEELKLGAGCHDRKALLSQLDDAIAADGEFQSAASAWSKRTLETLDPERWREMIAAHGVMAFQTYDAGRISVLRNKVIAAGGAPGQMRFFSLRSGDVELPLYILPLN